MFGMKEPRGWMAPGLSLPTRNYASPTEECGLVLQLGQRRMLALNGGRYLPLMIAANAAKIAL
jgi:hypothetical protein